MALLLVQEALNPHPCRVELILGLLAKPYLRRTYMGVQKQTIHSKSRASYDSNGVFDEWVVSFVVLLAGLAIVLALAAVVLSPKG